MRIYPSITTTKKDDWKKRLQEAQSLGLKEVCFFATCLDTTQRQEVFDIFQQVGIQKIPFIHLRNDMTLAEIQKWQKTFHTQRFNCHAARPYIGEESWRGPLGHQIYVENSTWRTVPESEYADEEKQIQRFGGICLDVTHIEDDRRQENGQKHFQHWMDLLHRYPCGVWHVSAARHEKVWDEDSGCGIYDKHSFLDVSEFDYLAFYKDFIPQIIALELENTLAEQLTAKKHIEENVLNTMREKNS